MGYWKATKNILKRGELSEIVFDGKAILVANGVVSNSVYEGIYISKTWEEVVALPPQGFVIKSFYQDGITEDHMA